MRFILIIVFGASQFLVHAQKKDSSVAQSGNPEVRITANTESLDDYFVITITADNIKARQLNKSIAINTLAQLSNYLAKNIQNINKEKVAVEYPLTASFQLVDPVFDLLKKNKISRWRMIPFQ